MNPWYYYTVATVNIVMQMLAGRASQFLSKSPGGNHPVTAGIKVLRT